LEEKLNIYNETQQMIRVFNNYKGVNLVLTKYISDPEIFYRFGTEFSVTEFIIAFKKAVDKHLKAKEKAKKNKNGIHLKKLNFQVRPFFWKVSSTRKIRFIGMWKNNTFTLITISKATGEVKSE